MSEAGLTLVCHECQKEFISKFSCISTLAKPICETCFKKRPGQDKPETPANPIGRPEKYTAEYAQILAVALRSYTEKESFPLWCEFAYRNKCNFRKAQDLCKLSVEFREAYEEMHAKEETVLLKGGAAGKLNASMATLILKNHRMSVDYREKQEVGDKDNFENYFQDIKSKAAARKKKREDKA